MLLKLELVLINFDEKRDIRVTGLNPFNSRQCFKYGGDGEI